MAKFPSARSIVHSAANGKLWQARTGAHTRFASVSDLRDGQAERAASGFEGRFQRFPGQLEDDRLDMLAMSLPSIRPCRQLASKYSGDTPTMKTRFSDWPAGSL